MSKVEEHIRKAIEAGEFENLPGAGHPLNLDENPFEDPEWRTAYRVLRNSGFTLPWIETRREIDRSLEAARNDIKMAWNRWMAGSATSEKQSLAKWERALARFREDIFAINERIFSYNLEVPADRFQMPVLNVEREIKLTTTPPSDTLPDDTTD